MLYYRYNLKCQSHFNYSPCSQELYCSYSYFVVWKVSFIYISKSKILQPLTETIISPKYIGKLKGMKTNALSIHNSLMRALFAFLIHDFRKLEILIYFLFVFKSMTSTVTISLQPEHVPVCVCVYAGIISHWLNHG